MSSIGYRYYYLFIICNFTNALFFWLLLPETSCRPLEEMNAIFHSSWIVVGQSKQRPRRNEKAGIQVRQDYKIALATHKEKLNCA